MPVKFVKEAWFFSSSIVKFKKPTKFDWTLNNIGIENHFGPYLGLLGPNFGHKFFFGDFSSTWC